MTKEELIMFTIMGAVLLVHNFMLFAFMLKVQGLKKNLFTLQDNLLALKMLFVHYRDNHDCESK